MASPPPDNILLDPLSELKAAFKAHAFGIDPSSTILTEESYPRTAEEREIVAAATRANKDTPERVLGRARIVLLNNEGEAVVRLDERGYTIEHTTSSEPLSQRTFESFDALLIALSPAYVATMQSELMQRFAQGVPERQYHVKDDGDDEPAWID